MAVLDARRDIVGSGGGKSGDGGGGATESPDSLHSTDYARILDIISTGEIVGPVNGLQSITLGGTPIQNPDGSLNFNGVTVDFRAGTQTQDVIAGFPAVENEIGVGVELTSDSPWVKSLTDTQLSAVSIRLSVSGLSQANTSTGDIGGYRIDYAIDVATDNGVFVQQRAMAFDGKTTQTYSRSHRINLPPASIGWSVRVRRLTPNSHSASVADTTNVVSMTQIIDAKFRYPMAALVGIQIDASQFQNIPVRAYYMRGRIIRVPTNYDAATRTYIGVWDGTFKVAYTNNPAWILYDLILHDIYGLGRRITAAQVDEYELYRIAQYCDEMVSNGKGGLEPRFTCNLYVQRQVPAYKLIQDIAAIFHGVAYWGGGRIIIIADIPEDPVYTYTAANVIDGKFSRMGSPSTKRYTVALVSWNDNTDGGKQKVEPVIDRAGMRRYGVQQVELAPIGCTSQAQAHRHGLWALLTANKETDALTFSVGLEYLRASPGKIVRIVDPGRSGRRNGGRIRAVTERTVTIDKAPLISVGDEFTCILPTAVPETRIVESIAGDTVTVTAPWSITPAAQSIWSVDNDDLKAPTYRVISVKDNGDLTYSISAIQHEPGKYAFIDNGTRIEEPPITVIPPSVQPPPTNVQIDSYEVINQGIATSVMSISWLAATSATAYLVEWKKDDGNWIALQRTGLMTIEVPGIYAGRYNARVRAVNAIGVKSAPAYANEAILLGKTSLPPTVTSLMPTSLTFGIGLNWGFPAQGVDDTQRTEIWYSPTPNIEGAQKLDFAYPQNSYSMMGLGIQAAFYFWARLVDTTGNEGPFYPDGAGVFGRVSQSATDILDVLAGEITKDQFGQQVLETIEFIENAEDVISALPDAATVRQIIARESTIDGDQDALAATQLIAMATADAADARTRTVVQSTFEDARALIVQESHTRATETEALSQSISTVQAGIGDAISAGVEEVSQAVTNIDGTLSALWSVKAQVTEDGKTYQAGIVVGAGTDGEVTISEVLVSAQRFAILDEVEGETVSPFIVQDGIMIVNVAVIGDATITTAKIADASITSAKIGTAAITNAKIGAAAVDTLTVAGNAITQTAAASGGNGLSVTITTTGGPVQVLCSSDQIAAQSYFQTNVGDSEYVGYFDCAGGVGAALYRNGSGLVSNTVQGSLNIAGIGSTHRATAPLMYLDHPPAGTHTYSVAAIDYGVDFTNRPHIPPVTVLNFLSVLEVKR